MTTPEDAQDEDEHDGDPHIDLHALALRLILSGLRLDDLARDEVLDEIGDCPGCQRTVMLMLVYETCDALVGHWDNPEDDARATEAAITYISDVLAVTLDAIAEHDHHNCEGEGEPPQ